jgi:NTE family protein
VIHALQEANIRIDCISGASIGALVGAIYCAGELDELEDFIRDLNWRDMITYFDMVFPTSGLLDGEQVYELAF